MRAERLLCTLALFGFSAMATGCVARAQGGVYAAVSPPVVFVAPPTLVEIDTGVWVAAASDYPVYYYDGLYWAYRDDVWFRSDMYDRGWVRVDVDIVPNVIVHRDHSSYVHYRAEAGARTAIAPRVPGGRPAARGIREPQFGAPPAHSDEPRRGPPEERDVEPRRGPPDEHGAEPHGDGPRERGIGPRGNPHEEHGAEHRSGPSEERRGGPEQSGRGQGKRKHKR